MKLTLSKILSPNTYIRRLRVHKGIYGERNPRLIYGDAYLLERGSLALPERVAIRLLNTRLGWRTAIWFMTWYPEFFIERLGQTLKPLVLQDIDKCLQHQHRLNNFEDLAPLLRPNLTHRMALQLDLDEAAYLFSLARACSAARILEIGRYRGGGTVLFATATDARSTVTSIDNLTKPGCDDEALKRVLGRFGLSHKVHLIAKDSTGVPAQPESYDLVFIDGDHRYAGVMADYEHWKYAVKVDGHMLFHDAVYGRRFASMLEDVARCANEIRQRDHQQWVTVKEVGSMIHLQRTKAAW